MAWCPECGSEYREGFSICKECNKELVDSLEVVQKEQREYGQYDYEVLLTAVSNKIEASIIESLLQMEGIPVMRKYKGSGQYLQVYMGNSFTGIDLYVPSRCLDRAKEILASEPVSLELPDDEKEEEDTTDLEEIQDRYASIKRWGIILLLAPTIIGIVVILVTKIYSLIR